VEEAPGPGAEVAGPDRYRGPSATTPRSRRTRVSGRAGPPGTVRGGRSASAAFDRAEGAPGQLAERLRELRESRGLTQARLAELLDVSPRVYNRWETTETTPRLDTLVRIADILSVTLDELVGRAESDPEPQIRNPRLRELYDQIHRLSDEDQQALVILLDSLVKRSQIS